MADSVIALTDTDESTCSSSSLHHSTTKMRGQRMEYSHKLTEKRRRDRMNISMSEIAQLLPTSAVTKQLEKAEILEKTISYIKKLQDLTGNLASSAKLESSKQTDVAVVEEKGDLSSAEQVELTSKYYSGFSDCIKEVFHCLTNVEAMDLQQPCFQRLMGHLGNQLPFTAESEEAQTGVQNKDAENADNFVKTTSSGSVESLSSSKHACDSQCLKRTHGNDEEESVQSEAISGTTPKRTKRAHFDLDKTFKSSKTFPNECCSNSSCVKEKKRKASLCANGTCSWVGNGGSISNGGSSSCGSEKEKGEGVPELSRSSKQENKNSFDGASVNSSGSTGMSGNLPLAKLGLDILMQATPISPRVPYIPSPFHVPTYALHPAGTHFIPVVLHQGLILPPFSEMNGQVNLATPNWPRVGGLHLPSFTPGLPLLPHVNGFSGFYGMHNARHDSTQKHCDQIDPSSLKNEHSTINGTTSSNLLNQELV